MNQETPDGAGAGLPTPAPEHARPIALRSPQAISVDVRGPAEPDASDEINLLDYWRIIVKRRWTVLGVLGIVFVTALVGTLLMTPIYRASTTLQIERDTM